MTPLDAVAAAIRERLLAGRPAPLPGLGTLVRQHVSARVEERPDGSRVLLPPGETIGLAGDDVEHESLAPAFGRLRSLDPGEAPRAYADAMDQVEARLAATGEVRLPGVGLLRRTSGGVVLGVEADLLAAVNRTYEGLVPVGTAPPSALPPADTSPTTAASGSEAPDARPDARAHDGLLHDLSPNPGSPFEPPAFPDPDSGDPPFADVSAEPEEAPRAPAGRDGPEPGAPPSPTDVSFVDDDALDADLDDVLAVPFGEGPDLSEVLPPTPPDRVPDPDEPASAPAPADDWEDEATWTAPLAPRPSFGGEDEIEDAEVVQDTVPEPVPDAPPAPEPERPPEPEDLAPPRELAEPLGEPPTPEAGGPSGLGPFVDEPPALPVEPVPDGAPPPAGDVGAPGATPAPPSELDSRFPWWLVALILVLLAGLALAWLWPRLRADPEPRPVATAERPPASETPGPAGTSASGPADPTPGALAAEQTTAPLPPPDVAGLPPADVQALSGRDPIRANDDPDASTWIVLSTPDRDRADALYARYQRAGYRTAVLGSDRGARTMYRLAVGQFASEADANRLRDRLPPDAPSDSWVLNLRTL